MSALFEPVRVGAWDLAHRVVLAPLTRCRAIDNLACANAATYYAQRATRGGLLISEATVVAPEGFGYPNNPGIFTSEQVEAWKPVTRAVRDKGGVFLCQLWHVGRVSHPAYQPDGAAPVSASPIAIKDHKCLLPDGSTVDYTQPRELRADELPDLVERYVQGARNALEAGFDGVEIHAANGYLLDSFLKDGSNQRADGFGGSVDNRARFPLQVIRAVAEAVGPERVGVRLNPYYVMAAEDSHKYATFCYLLEELAGEGLAYVHAVEPRTQATRTAGSPGAAYGDFRRRGLTLDAYRAAWPGTFMVAGGHTRETGAAAIADGRADLVVYGRLFISNPDLPRRLRLNAPLAPYDRSTFYSPDPVKGFIDYPALTDEEAAAAEAKASDANGDV